MKEDNPVRILKPVRTWLYVISPCMIAAALCLFAVIDSYLTKDVSKGRNYVSVIAFLPVLISVIAADLLIKTIFKKQAGQVWLIETILIIIFCGLYKAFYS